MLKKFFLKTGECDQRCCQSSGKPVYAHMEKCQVSGFFAEVGFVMFLHDSVLHDFEIWDNIFGITRRCS